MIRVLVYQKIGTPPQSSALTDEWTALKRLTRTLDKIKKHGFSTVSPAEIRSGKIPQKSVLLLFLDGYLSFYTDVYPQLKARELAACVCLPTACLGGHNRWQDPYRESWQDLMSWEEINQLAQDPKISFGAQSLNREDLSLLPLEQAQYAAQESIFRLTKQLPHAPELFAFLPMKNRIKNTAEILPGFSGLILTEDKANATLPLKISWGNSWLARWSV